MPAELRAWVPRSCSATPTTCTSGRAPSRSRELGGLHRFMAWDGPILTDSGGFQVFSLRHTADRVDDEGVTFRSVYDGSRHRFTPELAMDVQRLLGSDIAMAFDECTPRRRHARGAGAGGAPHERSGRSAPRRPSAPPDQLVFGIVQGGTDLGLRERSAGASRRRRLRRLRASAASRWARSARPMLETTSRTAALLPADRPRYFMGIGDPHGVSR